MRFPRSVALVFLPLLFAGALFADRRGASGGLEQRGAWKSSGWSPIELSLFSPVQIFSRDTDIYGLRFNLIFGRSRNIFGLDLGIVNSTRLMGGIQFGLWNHSRDAYGVQIGLFGNIARGDGAIADRVYDSFREGLALPGIYEKFPVVGSFLSRISRLTFVIGSSIYGNADMGGFQLSLGLNSARHVIGVQCCGLMNAATGNLYRIQTALLYNFAQDVYGLQFSAIGLNRAETLHGMQISVIGWNLAASDSIGMQMSILGNSAAHLYGAQIGGFNLAGGAGLQLGIVNFGIPFAGVQLGAYNRGGIDGLAVGVINDHEESVRGLAIAVRNSGGGTLTGAQLALLDNVTSKAAGFQAAGLWNTNETSMAGVQLALVYNASKTMSGVQMALAYNSCTRMTGVQFALL